MNTHILPANAAAIQRLGIDPKDIGVHSIRKGAATYCCNGTTAGVAFAAVCVPTIQDVELRLPSTMTTFTFGVAARKVMKRFLQHSMLDLKSPIFDCEVVWT